MTAIYATFTPGDVAISVWTCVPASGTVVVADVTARTIDPDGNIVSLAPTAVSANTFQSIFTVGDTAKAGDWVLRWESNPGTSPKLVKEVAYRVSPSAYGAAA